jgi:hypothetical protein
MRQQRSRLFLLQEMPEGQSVRRYLHCQGCALPQTQGLRLQRIRMKGQSMRHLSLVIPALLLVSPASAIATDGDQIAADVPAVEGGKIVIYRRGSVVGAALACPIRYKGEELTELGRGKFAEWNVAPGRYILENKTGSVEVYVEPGETRYVRCQIKTGMMTGRADLQIVDGTEFAKLSDDLKRSDKSPD